MNIRVLALFFGLFSTQVLACPVVIVINSAADIEGLDKSEECDVREVVIKDSADIFDLEGLSFIRSAGSLFIQNNSALSNLNGLSPLEVHGLISISGNPQLEDASALTLLPYASDGVCNPALGEASLDNSLIVFENKSLANLPNLEALVGTNRNVIIRDNPRLSELNSLKNLRWVNFYETAKTGLIISGNESLNDCKGLARLFGWPDGSYQGYPAGISGEIVIQDNQVGCNSSEEILSSVAGPTQPYNLTDSQEGDTTLIDFVASYSGESIFPIIDHEARCSGADIEVSRSFTAAKPITTEPLIDTVTLEGYEPASVAPRIELRLDMEAQAEGAIVIELTSPSGVGLQFWNSTLPVPEMLTNFSLVVENGSACADEDLLENMSLDGDWELSLQFPDYGDGREQTGELRGWSLRLVEVVTSKSLSPPITMDHLVRRRDYECSVTPVTALGTIPESETIPVRNLPPAEARLLGLLELLRKTPR